MRKNKLGTQWSLEKVKNSSLGPDSGREGVSRDISQNLPEVSRDDGWTRASWIHSLSSSLAEFCQRSSSISSVASLLVPSLISSMTSPLVSSVAPSSISPAVSSLISSSASEEGAGVLEGKTSVSREFWSLPEVSRDDGWTRASWIHSLSSSLAEFCQRSSSISSVASLLVPSSISSMTSPLVSSVAPSSISPAVSSLISSSASEEGAGVLEGKTSVSRELWKSLEDLAGGVPEGEGKWSPRIRESSGGDDLALSRLENMCGKLAQLMTREPLASKARLEVSSIQRRLYGYQ